MLSSKIIHTLFSERVILRALVYILLYLVCFQFVLHMLKCLEPSDCFVFASQKEIYFHGCWTFWFLRRELCT